MSKLKLLTIAVVGLLLLNLSTLLFLFLHKPPHPADQRGMMDREGPKKLIIDRLHFDPAQVAQYEKLIDEHQASMRSLNDRIKNTKNLLYESLAAPAGLEKDSLIESLGQLQRKVELAHVDHFSAIRSLCHPDQLPAFKRLTKDLARYFAPDKKRPPGPKEL